jgi:hypothetical protein
MIRWLNSLASWSTNRLNRASHDALLTQLRANTAREEHLADVMGRLRGVDVNDQLDEILTLREERVEIMRQLGWHHEADELAADTAMRRSWPPIDTTPIRVTADWTQRPPDGKP